MSQLRHKIWAAFAILLALSFFSVLAPTDALAAATKPSCRVYYNVEAGDTILGIVKAYNLTIKKFLLSNTLGDKNAIFVGQSVCIPTSSPKFDANEKVPDYAKRVAADFSTVRKGQSIIVKAKNFPTNSAYYVKIGKPETTSKDMVKVGVLNTEDKHNLNGSFTVPNNYRTTWPMKVCLKDVYGRTLICRTATR
jgi:LysM repeat protein